MRESDYETERESDFERETDRQTEKERIRERERMSIDVVKSSARRFFNDAISVSCSCHSLMF